MKNKKCKQCAQWKDVTEFEDRKDGWGQYSMCNECRRLLGRDNLDQEQIEYMEKTDVFILRD